MGDFFKGLGTRLKLLLLVSILISGLIIYGLIFNKIMERLKIHGPYYDKIIEGRDIATDIVPPRLFIVQPFLLSFQELLETDSQKFEKLIALSENYYIEFEILSKKWLEKLPEGPLEEAFLEVQYYANEFFSIWRNQFIPAITAKNFEEAQKILMGIMRDNYKKHREAITQVIKILDQNYKNLKDEIENVYEEGQRLAQLAWVGTIFLCCLLAYFIGYSITNGLNHALGQIDSVSKEINSTMSKQDQSITQQSGSVHEITAAIDELNASFAHTHLLAQESSNRAKSALKLSEDGNHLTKEMLENLMGHKEKVSEILNQIFHLSEVINQIHNVVSTINNLTNQTNILALNAAVQATRVKQNSGEGFSVIAGEIRKLADESKKFVAHIDVLAGNIKQATDSTVRIAEEGSKTVQESIKLAEASSKAFEEIITITTNSFEGAEQVYLNVTQQGQAVHQVLEAMEILNESTQQSLQGMKEVNASINNLNRSSEDLKRII